MTDQSTQLVRPGPLDGLVMQVIGIGGDHATTTGQVLSELQGDPRVQSAGLQGDCIVVFLAESQLYTVALELKAQIVAKFNTNAPDVLVVDGQACV